jgi:hypothetical protein
MTVEKMHKMTVRINWIVITFFAILFLLSSFLPSCSSRSSERRDKLTNNSYIVSLVDVIELTDDTIIFNAEYTNGVDVINVTLIAPREAVGVINSKFYIPKIGSTKYSKGELKF